MSFSNSFLSLLGLEYASDEGRVRVLRPLRLCSVLTVVGAAAVAGCLKMNKRAAAQVLTPVPVSTLWSLLKTGGVKSILVPSECPRPGDVRVAVFETKNG